MHIVGLDCREDLNFGSVGNSFKMDSCNSVTYSVGKHSRKWDYMNHSNAVGPNL